MLVEKIDVENVQTGEELENLIKRDKYVSNCVVSELYDCMVLVIMIELTWIETLKCVWSRNRSIYHHRRLLSAMKGLRKEFSYILKITVSC